MHHKKNVLLVVSSSGYGVMFSKRFMNELKELYLPSPNVLVIFWRIAHRKGLGKLLIRILVMFFCERQFLRFRFR